MKNIDPKDVPVFSDILHFTEWYLDAGGPIMIPQNAEVFLSDDATAFCLFRSGRYQFEMYLIHPHAKIPLHEHPGVENIEVPSPSWDRGTREDLSRRIQKNGMRHGGSNFSSFTPRGFALYSAQRWDDGIPMSTIGARWKGPTVGPKHEALIRRFNPDCAIENGFADVTRLVSPVLS